MKNFLFLFVFLLNSIYCAHSQTISSKNITVNDGLPSNDVKCFFKDSRGLLWIGTDAGLCCYNGSTYKVFNETNGLKYTSVWSIVEDEKHNLWFSLYGNGFAKYNGKKFTYYDEKNGLINNNIRKIHYSKKYKCLILATENGLTLFDGKKFKSFQKKDYRVNFQITGVDELQKAILVTTSYNGVYQLKIKSNLSKSTLDSSYFTGTSYSSFVNRNLYLAGDASHNLVVKNLKNKSTRSIPCPIIWNYAQSKDNTLYFATTNIISPEGGLYSFKNNQLKNITEKTSITSNALWCLKSDNYFQTLWVGSADKGIYKVDLSKQFEFLKPSFFGLENLEIQEMFNDKNNNTWIGAKDYIIKLRPDLTFEIIDKSILWKKTTTYLKHLKLNPNSNAVFARYKIKEGFTCFNIVSDKEGFVWVSTTWGAFCFDKRLNIIHYNVSDGGHISFDHKDRIYFNFMYADTWFVPNKFDWLKVKNISIKNPSIPRNIVKVVNDGELIWFGSHSEGLFLLQNNTFQSLNLKGLFSENNIKELVINNKGQLVIGTNSGRIYITKWNGKSLDVIKIFRPNKEIIGSTISFIEKSNGAYFIGTNKGINIIKNNKFVKLINQSEGINDVQFNDCIKDKKGNLLIATNDGLITLNCKELVQPIITKSNPIRISNIIINGKSLNKTNSDFSWGSYNNTQLKLAYNQNDIELIFGANNTYNADKNLFRYNIVGFSNTWSNYESVGRIQLRGITNGNYSLILEGKNRGTGEVFLSKELNLIITPPFWKTAWFILLVLVVIAFSIYFFLKTRIAIVQKREREKAELSNKLLETRLEALRAQMNPHFTFNAMNSIQNFIIDSDTIQALHYLGEFSKLIRQTLENATEKLMSVNSEINFLNSYITVQKMRFDGVKTSLMVDDSIDIYTTQIPPLILQPFIENAFEHAFDNDINKEQTIELHFSKTDEILICVIKDNGKGFKKGDSHSVHKSMGQQLTLDRLNLLNQEFKTDLFKYEIVNLQSIDSNSTGTEVTITFPLIFD